MLARKSLLIALTIATALLATCSSLPATAAPTPDDAETVAPTASPTATSAAASSDAADFALTSPAIEDGGALPVTFTCDGDNLSPPLAWSGAPEGTTGFALAMHHSPGPGDTHWYWVVFDIPATTQTIAAGDISFGTFGTNSVNGQQVYAPPCSQGPGEKLYTITVYALSAAPNLGDPASVDRDTLLAAIAGITLAEASLDFTYER